MYDINFWCIIRCVRLVLCMVMNCISPEYWYANDSAYRCTSLRLTFGDRVIGCFGFVDLDFCCTFYYIEYLAISVYSVECRCCICHVCCHDIVWVGFLCMMHTEEHFTNVFILRTEIVMKATMAIYGVYLSYDLLCFSSNVIFVCCLFWPQMEYT